MLVWAVAVGFENTVSISAKSNVSRVVQDFMVFGPCVTQENEDLGSVQDFILLLFGVNQEN